MVGVGDIVIKLWHQTASARSNITKTGSKKLLICSKTNVVIYYDVWFLLFAKGKVNGALI